MHTFDKMVLRPGPADFDEMTVQSWKFGLLAGCLPQAMSIVVPEDAGEREICNSMMQNADSATRLAILAPFQKIAATQALQLLKQGNRPAALAWGRSAYVASRHVNHAWLDFFDVLRSCNVIESLDAQADCRTSSLSSSIPRRLVQYRPENYYQGKLDSQVSWSSRNPSYEYTSFNDVEAENYLRTHIGSRVHAAYATASTYYRKSIILALAWLLEHGGIYADRNEVCNASLDLLIGSKPDLIMPWHAGRPSVYWPQFMGSCPSSPLVGKLLRHVVHGTEWMTTTGHAIDDWMICGSGGFTMTLLDDWCERGAWPEAGRAYVLDNERYRTMVTRSDQDLKLFENHKPDQAPKVPEISTTRIDAIVKSEDGILAMPGGPPQRARQFFPDRILPPGAGLTIISADPANLAWQTRQEKPMLAPAAGVYWINDIKLSGHGCLWKGNDFIRLDSYLSDVAEGETRGGAWQTPWTHKAVRVVEEPVIVAFSPGYSCYGHWLVDELPRIGLLKLALGDSFAGLKFIFPKKIRAWGKKLLKFFFGIDDSQILYFDHEREMWQLQSVIIPTFLHRQYEFQPFVREFFAAYAPLDARPHRKICLSRGDWDQSKPDQRIFIQREKFERMAVDRGYEMFVPEELTLADQVSLMAETAVQIGEHGSAQHGSIFSRHSTIVGSINPLTSVQVNLGRIADDRNVLLFPETIARDANGSLRFGCSDGSLLAFFDTMERVQAEHNPRHEPIAGQRLALSSTGG